MNHDNLLGEMADKKSHKPVSGVQTQVYTFPEFGIAVEASSLEEATAKAKKQAKENE